MATPGFALFETPIGRSAVAWGPRGLVGVQLPEGSERATRARLRRRFPDAKEAPPPPAVARAIAGMQALLRGEAVDLSDVELDHEGVPDFHRAVYRAARAVQPGATVSYGELAAKLGAPGAARAVGQALGRNPFAIVVPCHRVLAAGGRAGGFSAKGGLVTKRRMLALEGVRSPAALPLFEAAGADGFDPRAAVAHLRAADPPFARTLERAGPFAMERKRAPTLFYALAEAITHQQLSGKAAATIFGRFCALFPRTRGGPTPAMILGASDEALRGAGLSRPKIAALRDLAAKAAAGEVPTLAEARRLADATVVERLSAVRGIGRWTAEMMLIFHLGRPDVLPVDDYGVRKGFALAFRKRVLPTPAELERRGERWRPYRTVATWYLWRALELDRA
jgi:O-6-methylguanine DNA methyltransferase